MAVGCRPGSACEASHRCVPGKVLIVSGTTYEPGTHVAMHYHTSQIDFYRVRWASRTGPVHTQAGDSFLIKSDTVLEHWNASTTEPLVFQEYVLVDEEQRSAVFPRSPREESRDFGRSRRGIRRRLPVLTSD